ncbi:hypothetical protein THAOC_05241 [Thalassiosira oceanica]|uniref:Uncharacterized protein n=1 Tax=Thalassiosira oceanica TaxID=159749 RepID=K0THM4_THAOC|nr:hypothetical protein THAOC_05241 [Thalassiosira oceanica]|eukprot:EJK73156.1 hypothetical protein THAOC_05241 [Thalassiosira oceanica]
MALAFEVSDSKEIAYAIAAHDEYLSYLAFAISDRDNEWTIDPTHEFYSCTFIFLLTTNHKWQISNESNFFSAILFDEASEGPCRANFHPPSSMAVGQPPGRGNAVS